MKLFLLSDKNPDAVEIVGGEVGGDVVRGGGGQLGTVGRVRGWGGTRGQALVVHVGQRMIEFLLIAAFEEN